MTHEPRTQGVLAQRDPAEGDPQGKGTERRSFLSMGSTALMWGGLVAAYGTLAGFMGRFLYPARPGETGWMYVSDLASIPRGGSIGFRTPTGAEVVIARQGSGSQVDAFIALSRTCPHLGCQVHWEAHNNRFFCPCHNGVFNPQGVATEGPPAQASQSLNRYPLKVENGLLMIEVPLADVAAGPGQETSPLPVGGPGHDPCLNPESRSRRV